MSIYQSQLSQCQKIQKSYESLGEESIQLHQEAIKVTFGGFKAFDINKRVRDIERKTRNHSMSVNAVNESLSCIEEDINLTHSFSEETRNALKEIKKLTESIRLLQNHTMTYVRRTRDCLSETFFGAIIGLCQEIVNTIKGSLIVVIKITTRVLPHQIVPKLLDKFRSFGLLPGK